MVICRHHSLHRRGNLWTSFHSHGRGFVADLPVVDYRYRYRYCGARPAYSPIGTFYGVLQSGSFYSLCSGDSADKNARIVRTGGSYERSDDDTCARRTPRAGCAGWYERLHLLLPLVRQ